MLIGTIGGGGKYEGERMGTAFQPAVHRKWIDAKLTGSGEAACWVPLPG